MKNVYSKSRAAKPSVGWHTLCRATESPAGQLGSRCLDEDKKALKIIGDDGDDKEGSSEDDKDDDIDIEANEEEEEEHPAPADSVVVALPAADQAPSAEKTEPISLPAPVLVPSWSDSEVARLLAMSSLPSSPLSPLSSPPPWIPFPPLPPILSPPSLVLSPAPPPSPIRSLGYRAAMI
nr:hypothetical protein [Tanacetum cinerariifolium]